MRSGGAFTSAGRNQAKSKNKGPPLLRLKSGFKRGGQVFGVRFQAVLPKSSEAMNSILPRFGNPETSK
jgi:hypothetical protein